MLNLILILLTLTLLIGFFFLRGYETRNGIRIFSYYRANLDNVVARAEFIIENVNLIAFLQDEIRHLLARAGHYIAHLSLLAVRYVERLLTGLVRRMRNHPEIDPAPRETAREFVKTLSDFKDNLKATHPEISDIK